MAERSGAQRLRARMRLKAAIKQLISSGPTDSNTDHVERASFNAWQFPETGNCQKANNELMDVICEHAPCEPQHSNAKAERIAEDIMKQIRHILDRKPTRNDQNDLCSFDAGDDSALGSSVRYDCAATPLQLTSTPRHGQQDNDPNHGFPMSCGRSGVARRRDGEERSDAVPQPLGHGSEARKDGIPQPLKRGSEARFGPVPHQPLNEFTAAVGSPSPAAGSSELRDGAGVKTCPAAPSSEPRNTTAHEGGSRPRDMTAVEASLMVSRETRDMAERQAASTSSRGPHGVPERRSDMCDGPTPQGSSTPNRESRDGEAVSAPAAPGITVPDVVLCQATAASKSEPHCKERKTAMTAKSFPRPSVCPASTPVCATRMVLMCRLSRTCHMLTVASFVSQEEDLKTLEGSAWLSDAVLAAYLTYLDRNKLREDVRYVSTE